MEKLMQVMGTIDNSSPGRTIVACFLIAIAIVLVAYMIWEIRFTIKQQQRMKEKDKKSKPVDFTGNHIDVRR